MTNQQQEAFAQAVACGVSATQAFRAHVAAAGARTSACMTQAGALLAVPEVARRLAELRAEAAVSAAERYGFTRERLVGYLVEVLETPVGELDEHHRLTHEMTCDTLASGAVKMKVKGVSKEVAARLLAQICGWNGADAGSGPDGGSAGGGTLEVVIRKQV